LKLPGRFAKVQLATVEDTTLAPFANISVVATLIGAE
jgi:hypothetical protein